MQHRGPEQYLIPFWKGAGGGVWEPRPIRVFNTKYTIKKGTRVGKK